MSASLWAQRGILAGLRPYELSERTRTVLEVVALVVQGPPEPPGRLAPGAPPELVAICEKAMAHRWCDRYPEMSLMAEDLRAYREGRVVSAHATGTLARLQKWVTRNRALSLSLATSFPAGADCARRGPARRAVQCPDPTPVCTTRTASVTSLAQISIPRASAAANLARRSSGRIAFEPSARSSA